MSGSNIQVVRQFLEALEKKDLSALPASGGMTFDNPITGKGKGLEAYRAFHSGFLPSIGRIEVRRLVADGEYVATHWEAETVFGIIPVLQLFTIDDGLITDSVTIFDPRPVLGS